MVALVVEAFIRPRKLDHKQFNELDIINSTKTWTALFLQTTYIVFAIALQSRRAGLRYS